MSEETGDSRIFAMMDERKAAVRDLAKMNASLTTLGRHLGEIAKALESGAPHDADDPLLWQLRDLSEDLAAVLVPERLLEMVGERQRLTKLVDQLTGYLRDMGINPV